MPPRKSSAPAAPAVTVEVVPVDPDAGVTFADHRAAAAMMLRALAGLDAETALERLRSLYASLPNGTARRAVLAARLTILRDDLPEPVKAAPPPPPTPAPVIKAPLKTGALSTLALDAAAKLLFDATAEDDDEPPPPKSKAPPPVADLFAALAATDDEDEDDGANETPASSDAAATLAETVFPDMDPDLSVPEDLTAEADDSETAPPLDPERVAKPPRTKAKPRKAKAVALDPAALAAWMEPEETPATVLDPEDAPAFVPTPPAAMALALSALSALDNDPPPSAAPASKPAFDLGAAFAAFDDGDDMPMALPDDLDRVDDLPDLPPQVETALPATQSAKPQRRKAAKTALPDHDIAASLSALISEGDSPVAPAMPDAAVSGLLGRIEPAAPDGDADPGPPKPKRKKPTNLSDVSAAFAAMTGDEAE